MHLSALQISPMLSSLTGLTRDDVEVIFELLKGIFGLVVAYISFRNRKDIDGVAEVAGTERAKARCDKKNKGAK